jgi:hypothetical protein
MAYLKRTLGEGAVATLSAEGEPRSPPPPRPPPLPPAPPGAAGADLRRRSATPLTMFIASDPALAAAAHHRRDDEGPRRCAAGFDSNPTQPDPQVVMEVDRTRSRERNRGNVLLQRAPVRGPFIYFLFLSEEPSDRGGGVRWERGIWILGGRSRGAFVKKNVNLGKCCKDNCCLCSLFLVFLHM